MKGRRRRKKIGGRSGHDLEASLGSEPNDADSQAFGNPVRQTLAQYPGHPFDDATRRIVVWQVQALCQHRGSHTVLAVPADEIHFPNAKAQASQESWRNGSGDISTPLWASTEADQKQEQRTLRTLRTHTFNGQEMLESLLFVNVAVESLCGQGAVSSI